MDGDRRADPGPHARHRASARDGQDTSSSRSSSTRPTACTTGGARDRVRVPRSCCCPISIGFTYAGVGRPMRRPTTSSARLVEAGRRYRAAHRRGRGRHPDHPGRRERVGTLRGRRPPVPPRALRRLSPHPELRTVTMAEACARPRHELPSIFPGSWIDANFYIWIGHADDQRAWSQLADAREALETPGAGARCAALRAGARGAARSPKAATGSGGTATTTRRRTTSIRRSVPAAPAQRLPPAGQPIPDELFVSNISTSGRPRPRPRRRPSSRRRSTARRRATSSGWAPARSRFETSPERMHRTDRKPGVLTQWSSA